ncbi:MAG TPA: carbamoyltransferase C-terminal domain-containing protein [Vicinamibacterales bacterium]|nr:carbamoyltransferase C-terminal domain-containing protein [Vicinamibacterales bacterium]
MTSRPGVVLGLTNDGVDTSAALVIDGRIHAAVAEERLVREKRTRRFPINAIQTCLRQAGVAARDVSVVAVAWNPMQNMERLGAGTFESVRHFPEMLYRQPGQLYALLNGEAAPQDARITQALDVGHAKIQIEYVDHHLAHAALAFFASPFDRAAILSIDGFGEKVTTALAIGEGGRIRTLETVEFPHSLGMFYETLTQFLGFRPDSDEWKVMGASAYGDPERYRSSMDELVRCTDEGLFEMDLMHFQYYLFSRRTHFHPRLEQLLGPPFPAGAELDQRGADIAAAAQATLERVLFHLGRRLHHLTGSTNLCLSGGVALNCLANGKFAAETPFERVFVPPAPEDMGTSLGAALNVAHAGTDGCAWRLGSNAFGPSYSDAEVKTELDKYRLTYRELDDPAGYTAERIANGRIVGWFQGGLEFGQRALGHRSILADPRLPDMKDRVNKAVKYREAFRPFAPAILADCAGDYFEDACDVPYMEKVLRVRPDKRAAIPAVTHVDGTSRLQTVSREQEPLFFALLDRLHQLTGVPLVLNTSFNVQGEPIVCSPSDALRTFFTCGLDDLVIERFALRKEAWE